MARNWKYAPGCPCCDEGDTTSGCSECGTAPLQWTFDISGLTNGTCSSCSGLDGTHVLDYIGPSNCIWRKTGLFCGVQGVTIDLRFESGSWTLRFASPSLGTAFSTYQTSPVGNCLTAKTLNFVAQNTLCNNWPSSITISPVT